MTPAPSVRAERPVHEPKVRLFTSTGAFLMRATREQVDHLIRAGLAE